jgi:competence protein ComEC
MKDWLAEKIASAKIFKGEYGKIVSLSLAFVIIFFSIFMLVSLVLPRTLKVSFLDIGQGDSIFIETPSGHTMIIDGGPSNAVMSRLHEESGYFLHDIDVMVATHPDSDHVTGLIPVLEKYDVKNILMSGETSDTGVFADLGEHIIGEEADMHIAHIGDVIDFQDGVVATILHPYVGEKFSDTNSASISLVLTYGDESFLLTGDLPSTNEPILLSSGLLPKDITVYKAGHHGSKYSSGEQLLSYIKPEYAIISVGADNRYGHPNPEAIARLTKYSKEILSTIDRGTISFLTDGKLIEVETQK